MGLIEAKKYLQDLHKKQSDPYLWPDYLTGLPDRRTIIKEMDEIFPKLGEYSIAYIRIANIQPYLLKYGPDKHAEIIQWAAAILKTASDTCPNSFIGAFNTHDFVGMCRTKHMAEMLKTARETFEKKIRFYYSRNDLKRGLTLSLEINDSGKIACGLMKLVSVVTDKRLRIKKAHLIRNMARVCDALEETEDEMVVMSNDLILKD
jgi:GGDEF domain-containing protein